MPSTTRTPGSCRLVASCLLVLGWIVVGITDAASAERRAVVRDASVTDVELAQADAVSDDSEEDGPDDDGMFAEFSQMVTDARNDATVRFDRFIYGIDNFFGANESVNDPYQSYARIRLGVEQRPADDWELDGTVKLRVVLPRSERRLRLLFSSESDTDDDPRSSAEELAREDDESAALALRFVRSLRADGSLSFDLGARMRDDKPQLFGRIDAGWAGTLIGLWTLDVENDLRWYTESGYDNGLTFDVRRPLTDDNRVFFRTSTGFNWLDGEKGASIGQTVGFYRSSIDGKRAVAVEALLGYDTALNGNASDRFRGGELRLRWRHNVWREWFYYEIWPTVGWPSSNDYQRAYGALFRIEVEIGDR